MNVAFLSDQTLPHTYERVRSIELLNNNVFFISWPIKGEEMNDNLLYLPYPRSLKKLFFLVPNLIVLSFILFKNKIEILHIMGIASWPYGIVSKVSKTKYIIEHNGSDILVEPKKIPILKWFYKIAYLFSNGVVQDSAVSKRAGINYGAPTSNNEIIDIGIDFAIFNPKIKKGVVRKKHDLSDNTKIILCPRGFKKIYNNEIIIKAARAIKEEIKRIVFIFCGYYDQDNELLKLVEKYNLNKNIIFAGVLDRYSELPYYYSDADIVVSIPSSDSSPLSVYEAMACMTPVVVSTLPWLYHNFLDCMPINVNYNDDKLLADKIYNLLGDPASSKTEEIYKIVNTKINLTHESIKLMDLYNKVVNK